MKKYWFFALLAPIFMIGEAAADLIQPDMMRTIIDDGVLGLNNNGMGNIGLVINVGIKMVGVVVLGGISGVLSGVFANMFSQNWSNDIRKACFRRITELSFEQTDKFSTGSLVTRVTNDVTQLQNLATQCVRGFVRTIMLFVGGIYCVAQLSLQFGTVLACTLPAVLIGVMFFIARATPFFEKLQTRLDRVNSVVQENVAGARVVKAYVREEYEQARFGAANNELVDTQLRVLSFFAFMTPFSNIILNIATVMIIKIGAAEVAAGSATPGSIMAAVTYISRIMHSVTMLAMIFQTVSRGKTSARRINEVLETVPAVADGSFDGETDERGSVEFKNVSFAYPQGSGELVLNGISLKIHSGETFGILGATGSGKSSLVNLIPRFYDCTNGEVLVDGINVKQYRLEALRDKIAIALQKSELFNTSIKENILWGDPSADDKAVEAAAEAAQAMEFISSRPKGFDDAVSEGGMSLSGGQKQRTAIARALLKHSEIIIFDDATSALDLRTESNLYEALNKEHKDVTKIIIAQRIASLKNADRIAVIDGGRIAACGPHSELMRTSELYRDIYSSQQRNGGAENE